MMALQIIFLAAIGAITFKVLLTWFVKHARKLFAIQHDTVLKIAKEEPVLFHAIKAMRSQNVFIYFNDIGDSDITDEFLNHLTTAWTTLTLKEGFNNDTNKVKVGYAFNNSKLSPKMLEELRKIGWTNANR